MAEIPSTSANSNNLIIPERKLSVVYCRICYDNDKDEDLIAPCRCKGTVAFVHRSCLEKWLGESGTVSCELCHYRYQTERAPKYTASKSIFRYLRRGPTYPGLITPTAIIVTYVCLYTAEYYNQQRFSKIPAAKWTSVSLLVMISIILFGYYLWVFEEIRSNAIIWYNWWQRSCVVRYIPPSNICLDTRTEQSVAVVPNNTPTYVEEEVEVEVNESVISIHGDTVSQGEGVTTDVVINIEPSSDDEIDLK